MKKLFLGAAIAMSSLTFAQTYGVKAGMNVSSLSKDASLSDQKSKIGFNAGVFANIPLAAQFSIQPELLYSALGAKAMSTDEFTLAGTTTKTVSSFTTSLDYLTVPVMFQYNATPSFYLEAGPEVGFMLSAKNKGDETTTVTTGTTTTTSSSSYDSDINKDNLNTINLGIGIGAGYYLTPNIGLTARYVAGLTDINNSDNNGDGDSVKNNVFQVGLAYKF